MHKDKLDSIFDGTDKAIADFFDLSGTETIDQKSTCRRIENQIHSASEFESFLEKLYVCIEQNRTQHQPSQENWRLKPISTISRGNKSPEVLLERAIACLSIQGHLTGWYNQIPVASGLIDDIANKRTAIDLLQLSDTSAEFIELKLASNTPLFAAIEILLYGLAYLYSYIHQSELGYDKKVLMRLKRITLSVLAPACYYDTYSSEVFIKGLDESLSSYVKDKTNGNLSMSFTMAAFPKDFTLPFEVGKTVTEQCDSSGNNSTINILMDAINKRQSIIT